MLTKRTNILFEENTWKMLTSLAARQDKSIGELVRIAVKRTYIQDDKKTTRSQVLRTIRKIRPQALSGKIDYKELINAGRKY